MAVPVSKLNTTEVRDDFSEIVNRVAYGKEHIILCRRGRDLAALVPADELELFELVLEKIEDVMDIAEAKKRLADKKEVPIPYKTIRKELGLK